MDKYKTVQLDQILCSSKGLSPTVQVDKLISKKGESMEVVSGINWYYYLVPGENHKSLIDHVGQNEIDKKFIVCATLPNDKKKNKVTRLFTAFNSVLDFLSYARGISRDKWYFFEVILGKQTQKLYFDIDIKQEDLLRLGVTNIDEFTHSLLTQLIARIVSTFLVRGHSINIAQQILLFSSNSLLKRSYHIIVDGYAVGNCRENQILVSEILDGFPVEFRDFIDTSMYSSKQQLRLLHSRKPGTDRPKIFVDQWYYGPHLMEYPYPKIRAPDKISTENLRFNMLFQASCVTVTNACQLITILGESSTDPVRKVHRFWSETGDFEDEMEITDDLLKVICERIDPNILAIYRVGKVIGSLVSLLRREGKGPKGKIVAECILCKREHESENAFLRLSRSGKVYFYCHRNDSSSKMVADVSALMPENEELAQNHLESIRKQLIKNTTSILLSAEPPSLISRHTQMKIIAAQPNHITKIKRPTDYYPADE